MCLLTIELLVLHYTGNRENLMLIAKLRHIADPKQITDRLLVQFGLSEAADLMVSTYSGGMRSRVDIAMSLIDL